jgi:hypothetical protein
MMSTELFEEPSFEGLGGGVWLVLWTIAALVVRFPAEDIESASNYTSWP